MVCQETIKGLTLDAEQEAGVKLELDNPFHLQAMPTKQESEIET